MVLVLTMSPACTENSLDPRIVLKLGTRKSWLAWAQSCWVAKKIEERNPDIRVELVGIETKGDKIQDVPLQSIEGKDFFVAELDQYLIGKKVDISVHSLKDLSLDRPSKIFSCVTPERALMHDVLIVSTQGLEKLKAGEQIVIGTSAPRRLENLKLFFERCLPRPRKSPDQAPAFRFLEIRGNVNTRLSRIKSTGDRRLDGVVLAAAGLTRLWESPVFPESGADTQTSIGEQFKKLFSDTHCMLIPISQNPTAPGQGALAIECREDDEIAKRAIYTIHHPKVLDAVKGERKILAEWGGGCHLPLGASMIMHSKLGSLFYVKGKRVTADGSREEYMKWSPIKPLPPIENRVTAELVWDGTQEPGIIENRNLSELEKIKGEISESATVFYANPKAVLDVKAQTRLVSGHKTWEKAARMGIWIHASAESFGQSWLTETLKDAPFLRAGPEKDWTVFTHRGAKAGTWVYELKRPESEDLDRLGKALGQANHVFWASFAQFETLKSFCKSGVTHACMGGKSADLIAKVLANIGLAPVVFPSVKEWRLWLSIK